MKKKILSILICTLLITAAIVIVPKDLNVRANGGGGGSESGGNVGLDYDYIFNAVDELSKIARSEDAKDYGIYKGRTFATNGERYAANQIESWMNNIIDNFDSATVKIEQIGNESSNVKYMRDINDKIEIKDFSLKIKDEGAPQDTTIPNNETFVFPKWVHKSKYDKDVNIDSSTYVDLVMINDDQSIMDWYNGETSFWTGLESDNIYIENCSYIWLGNQSNVVFSELIYIDDYPNASINESEGKIHLINTSDSEYNDTIDMLADDYNASGFILMRDNVSNIQNWTINISGVAVSEENGSMLYNLTQTDIIEVVPPEFIAEEGVETLSIFHIQEDLRGVKKIGLYNITGENYNPVNSLFWSNLLEALKLLVYHGIIIYDSTLPNTHFMNPVCEPNKNKVIREFGSLSWLPLFWINGTIGIDGEFTPIDEWYESADNPLAFLSLTQRYNTTPISYNVYCDVIGVNPEKTFILSGGHYDGWWGQSTIDTSTSVSTMLGILKYMNDSDITPKCNIRFITFGGEEYKKRGSWSHVYNNSNLDLLNQAEYMLNMDVLAHHYQNSILHINTSDSSLEEVIWNIGMQMNYDGIFINENYKLDVGSTIRNVADGYPFWYRSDKNPFDNIDITIIDGGKENLVPYHQTGFNHTLGDTMDILDQKDLNYTTDLMWNITKYFTVNPNCWFESKSYTLWDTSEDENDIAESVNITYSINTSIPHDKVRVRAILFSKEYPILYRYVKQKEYVVTPSSVNGYINISLPKWAPKGDYNLYVYLYNSTGRINNIVFGVLPDKFDTGFYANETYLIFDLPMHPPNDPPEKPDQPDGPVNIEPWTWDCYWTTTTDPNDDRIRYQWQWRKGFYDPWTGLTWKSGNPHWRWHFWLPYGPEIQIRVRAKDIWDSPNVMSDWSEPLYVNMENEGCYFPSENFVIARQEVPYNGLANGGTENYTWTWSFSTATKGTEERHTQNTTYQFNVTDEYNVTLRVQDNESMDVKYYIILNPVNLIANFTTNPSSAQPNVTITFNDTSLRHENISLGDLDWTWDFDDGNISYNQNTSHAYAVNGTYNVTLNITDNNGNYSVANQIIYIETTLPKFICVPYSPIKPGGNQFVTIYADFFDNESGVKTVKVNITYPNNTTGNFTMYSSNTTPYDFKYIFNNTSQIGQYNFTILVVDNANNSNSTTGFSFVVPPIGFVPPTPPNGSINKNYIHVNISSLIDDQHYVFTDFNYDNLLWMRMDDVNATYHPTDISSYSNNGTKYGDANQTNNGQFGKAFDFDGDGDYIRIPTLANGGLGYENGEFTISLRINTSTTGKTIVSDYYKSGLGLTEQGWNLRINNDKIRYTLANTTSVSNIDGTTNITDSNWTHIVVVDRGETAVTGKNTQIYINGNLEKDASRGGKATSSSRQFRIGAYYLLGLGSPDYFNGDIDEVMLFNRSLSETEILALYNASATQYQHNFTNLIHNVTYNFTGYAADINGDKNETETRSVTIDTQIPQITNVIDSPDTVGFGFNVTVSANVTDNGSGLDRVELDVTYPDNSSYIYTMDNTVNDTYQYVFSDTWLVGQYNYSIWAYDNASNSNISTNHSFNVSAQATMSIATLKDSYVDDEYINITDPPNPPEDYYIVGRGLTWDEYYNAVTGQNILEVSTGPINYQDENEEWQQINCSLKHLDENDSAYSHGYRTGNEHGLFNLYFKPNIQDDWPVAFAYSKSTDPTVQIIRNNPIGMGYLDPSHGWSYEYLQDARSSQGQVNDNSVAYEDVFTGTDVVWSYRNTGLKEDISMSNETKALITSRPPSEYGLSDVDSYLVFINEIDIQNLDMHNSSGILTGDFTISDDRIDFKDGLGNIKCSMPLGEAYELYNESVRQKLTYRFVRHGDTYYLLYGLKVSQLKNMSFPVVVDPELVITTIYSTASDGYIHKTSNNYNTAWTSSTGTVYDSYDYINIGQSKVKSNYYIFRGFLFFNTSSLPSNAYIDLANLSLYKKGDSSDTDFDITIQNGQPTYPHDPLQAGDYNKNHYSGNGGSLNTSNFGNGYNNIALTNYSWLTKEGMTKLCLRSSRDINGTAPTGSEYVGVYSNEKGGLYYPKLTITYRNQSKIKNTGSTNISGYLLIQVQYNNSGNWTVDHDTINDTSPRTINSSDTLALDLIFNGEVNTNELTNGNGTYRVYAAFTDSVGNILQCDDDTYLVAHWEFDVTFS